MFSFFMQGKEFYSPHVKIIPIIKGLNYIPLVPVEDLGKLGGIELKFLSENVLKLHRFIPILLLITIVNGVPFDNLIL